MKNLSLNKFFCKNNVFFLQFEVFLCHIPVTIQGRTKIFDAAPNVRVMMLLGDNLGGGVALNLDVEVAGLRIVHLDTVDGVVTY